MDMAVRVWEVAMVEAIITSPAWGDTMTMVSISYVRSFTLNTQILLNKPLKMYFLKLFNQQYNVPL